MNSSSVYYQSHDPILCTTIYIARKIKKYNTQKIVTKENTTQI